MGDIWDDVPTESYRAEDGRTVSPYKTFGPKDQPGVSWHEYFAAIRAQCHDPEAEEEDDEEYEIVITQDDEEYEIVITQEAEEFDDPCSPLATWVKRAHTAGWSIHTLAHAFSTQKQKPFKSGERAGQPRPDRNYEAQWLFVEKKGVGRATVYYLLNNGKVESVSTTRSFNGRRVSDKELQEILKR